jgi:hypothetical protein
MRYELPKAGLCWALAAMVLLLAPAGIHAQRSPEVRITPRVGLLTPPGWFYVEYAQFGVIPMEWTEAAVLRATVLGAALELAFESPGVWVRGEVTRTVGAETAVGHAVLYPASMAGPAVVVRTWFYVPTAITIATLDVGLPTRFRLPGGIQPYVTAGLGAKTYSFDTAELDAREENVIVPQDGTVPVVNVGAGATVAIRGITLDFLVRDAISEYWRERQNDVMFLAGLTLRVR